MKKFLKCQEIMTIQQKICWIFCIIKKYYKLIGIDLSILYKKYTEMVMEQCFESLKSNKKLL